MTNDSTCAPEMPKPIQDKDWLATLTRESLVEEAYRRNQVIAEIVVIASDRAEGRLTASDFDKAIADLLEGEGFLCAESLLKSFKKEDLS